MATSRLVPAVLAVAVALSTVAPGTARADEPDLRSPHLATTLALGSLAAAFAVGGAAVATNSNELGIASGALFLVGPSLGHAYAGAYGRALLTTGARATGAFMVVLAAAGSACWDDDCPSDDDGGALALGGIALVVGATVYDVFGAAPAARRYNAESRLTVTPTPIRTPSGTTGGIGLSGRF